MRFFLQDLRAASVGLIVGIGVLIISYKLGYQELIVICSILVFLYLSAVIIHQIRFRKPATKGVSKGNDLQALFGRIANLYNQSAIFVQQSYDLQQPSSGHKAQSLHRAFEEFMAYKNEITLSIPQELELATMSFFDLLLDYKKEAYLIINSSKSNECYTRWMDLKQRFDTNVAPHYSHLEVQFRQLLNKQQNT